MKPRLVTKVVNYKELLTTVNWVYSLWYPDFRPVARSCETNSAPQEYSEWPSTWDGRTHDRCSSAMCCLWHVEARTALHLPARWPDLEKQGLTDFGPDASCIAEFEETTFAFSPTHLLTLLLSHPLLLEKVKRSRHFSPFLHTAFLRFISLDKNQNFQTLALIPHLTSAFHFFGLAVLFTCAMFPCAMFPCTKMNFTLFSITKPATYSCRHSHPTPLLFWGGKGNCCPSTKHSPNNVHRQLRALGQCERRAHLLLMHDP